MPADREEHLMAALFVGYARVSTDEQDLTVQRDALSALGVKPLRSMPELGRLRRDGATA